MTTYVLAPCGFGAGAQLFDGNGDPLAGGKIYTYLAGTTTPTPTWTDHLAPATLNPNPILLDADGRVIEEIWVDLDLIYKFVLKDSTDVQIWEKDYLSVYATPPYVPPTPTPVLPEFVTLWEFLSPAQIASVVARDFTVDVSVEFQEAIDYVVSNHTTYSTRPIGTLFVPAGGYRLENPLIIGSPMFIQGAGMGGEWTTPTTDLRWYGNSGAMISFGTQGDGLPFHGGGLSRFGMDARNIASACLFIRGARTFEMQDLYSAGATTASIVMTNPASQPNPTGLASFRNIWVNQYNSNAIGIYIVSSLPVTAQSGSTLTTWDTVYIQHAGGAGLYVNGGDNHIWTRFLAFSQTGTAPGIHFAGTDPTNTESGHVFIDASATSGIQIDSSGDINDAITFINYNDGDMYPGLTVPFYGNGINRINATTHSGRLYGQFKTIGWQDTVWHDTMNFIAYGAPVLTTKNGSWTATAGAVVDGGVPGGAVSVATTNVASNIAFLCDCATLGASGVTTAQNPHLVFTTSLTDNFINTVHRWGFADSATNPPLNGIWIEANQAVHPTYFRCVVMKNGVATYLDQTVINMAAPGQILQWRIEVTNEGCVAFYSREIPNRFFHYMGSISSGLPLNSIKMDTLFQIITLENVIHTVFVYDVKKGFLTEG